VKTITLADGRTLSYAEYGDPEGEPVVLIHGIPGSRLFWGVLPGSPFRSDLRLIAPDRPGYGFSDFFGRGQTIVDYPNDVTQLADALGIEKFAVFGASGGGPYVLACAWKIPERLASVGVFASVAPDVPAATEGLAPTIKRLNRFAPRFPRLIRLQMAVMSRVVKWAPGLYARMVRSELSEADAAAHTRLNLRQLMKGDRAETYRQWGRGVAYDVTIPGTWPIPLDEIRAEVHIWQGEQDRTVSPSAGRYFTDKIRDSELTMIPDGGHMWIFEHMKDVLDVLVPAKSSP
jgi:pimeloyl-ACP methyl ester carboxylesterase